jgi:hypothetical protein
MSVSIRRLSALAVLACALLLAMNARAAFHTFQIEQIFSNADGTVQFVVMHESLNVDGEHQWANHSITPTHNGSGTGFKFPHNLPSSSTHGRRVLIATQGFADLGILTPDFIVPNNFLPTGQGLLNYADVDFVGYGALPTDGVTAINRSGQAVPNVATNFAGQSASVAPPAPPVFGNFQGLWWAVPPGSESGWGINLNHQGTTIFATWFTFGLDGAPMWLVVSATSTAAQPNVFTGKLFGGNGPPFNAFDSSKVSPVEVGTVTFTFTSANTASFAYTVNGVSQVKSIALQQFGTAVPVCNWNIQPLVAATNYQDIWWNAPANSEPGWGLNIAHQGDTLFATWFTFGLDGKPLWLAVSATKTADKAYAGTLFKAVSGPPFNAVPFDPALVKGTAVGPATLTFTDGINGSFSYTVDGIAQTKPITRQVFAPPGTVCQ